MTNGNDQAHAGVAGATTTSGCSEPLARWAKVLADWADRMPLRDVYIFDAHDRPEQTTLKIAIEYSSNASDAALQLWQKANSSDFAELRAALGMEICLFTDQDYDIWRFIRTAARVPMLTIGKVRVLRPREDAATRAHYGTAAVARET